MNLLITRKKLLSLLINRVQILTEEADSTFARNENVVGLINMGKSGDPFRCFTHRKLHDLS